MKWNEFKPEAMKILGLDAVEFAAESRAAVNMDALLELLMRVCVSDNMSAEVTLSSLRADLEEQARKAQAALRERTASMSEFEMAGYSGPRTVVAMGKKLSVKEVTKLVHDPNGPLNWVLINANQQLIEAGGGSVREMADYLKPTEAAFGMLRMGFGSGKFKRNYWLFIHWSGETVPVTQRGKATTALPGCKAALQPTQIDFFGSTKEEVTVDVFIKKVVRYGVVDGDTDKAQNAFTYEAFMESLAEDQAKLAEQFGISSAPSLTRAKSSFGGDFSSLDVREAVRSVRAVEDPFNWLVIQPVANAKVGVEEAPGAKLKKVVSAKSAVSGMGGSPFGDFKLKKSPHPAVMASIPKTAALKPTETNDRSAPVIDSGVKVGKNNHGNLMAAIKQLP